MSRPVALPIAFGSRRFGKVQGGTLATDGDTYTQPFDNGEYWQGGTTFLVRPPWTVDDVRAAGFEPDCLISGGQQDLYGKPVYGWIFCDAATGARWLIQPDFGGATTAFSGALSIAFDILPFGIFDGGGERTKTTVTETLSDWGQGSSQPAVSLAPASTCSGATVTSCSLYLVSAKKDGSVAVLMASLFCESSSGYEFSSMETLRQWPIGFIGVTCTADPDGGPPSLSLSVLRDRETTLGTRSSMGVTSGITYISLCGVGGGTINDAAKGSETFTQGVSDEILALFYDDDVLTEMTVDCTIEGSSTLDDPVFTGVHWEQHSVGQIDITWQLSCNGNTASWVYSREATMDAVLICGSGSYWSQYQEEALTDGATVFQSASATTSDSDYTTTPPVMPNAALDSGSYIFTLHGACRSAGDLWLDGFLVFGGTFFSMEFVRYAYNVIGVAARGGVSLRGPALAPSGKIPAGSVGSGNYGAWNARTGDAVAGEATTVSYV